MTIFEGAAVALITPMHEDGSVDYKSLENLVEWQIQSGIDAIVACGTTGEASTLIDEEHIAVIEAVVKKAAGRVPVIGGTGSNNTQHGIHLSKEAQRVGADGLLVVTPYYNKATKSSLVAHYKAIAESVELPILLYSVHARTGMNLDVEAVKELKKIPNIVGIKEASGDISQVVSIAREVDEDFALYSGNDDQVLPFLSVGGTGVISTISNIAPTQTSEMVHAYLNGELNKAKEMQLAQKPLIDALFAEVNPVPVKAGVALMDNCQLTYRLPLGPPETATLTSLKQEMEAYGIL
ncbi:MULTISPECIES: 4-hydroxy-tetrahydrodipicolinate synthase [Enterococcus]|uniref:4-hydroxy-tetrahydrodipicolinate synthase n=1 Tax=Enterococcus sulfureus ATCC 49903 TaxID=1140003 RepID=S0KZI4_9ENTE|nr:4-hydroxy-tetrahydrodipicolinate synthase [Enterococcus sulfureus]EOT45503.1 dihydrodipicolinate synthase [Enterococcus sulfureus ATCC 49903]EOT83394.1 dihydrodipicolinate synthase [Enterococcus sulfureus ATCC 49903]